MEEAIYSATGGRKTATAFVKMIPGSGKIIVNGRDAAEYFGRDTSVMLIERPLRLTNT
ncbi:MAG TPA: 30S ribosomal protein S9, partial [Candidatus Latescibacteria bacterium]|nr:30S ribosomal protein S9 [Candidatus Latescibacterota bacterium]